MAIVRFSDCACRRTHAPFSGSRSRNSCPIVACKQKTSCSGSHKPQNRRSALLAGLATTLTVRVAGARAAGLESISSPQLAAQEGFAAFKEKNQALIDKTSDAFESSDLLKTLRERSDANRAKNKRDLQDKYCARQAEMGVGDCAGLQLIPGMTKSGKQKTPEWLENVLRKLGQLPEKTEEAAAEAAS